MSSIEGVWIFSGIAQFSLVNPSKDRERSVDAIVFIAAPDWSDRLSNFENVIETQFDRSSSVECC